MAKGCVTAAAVATTTSNSTSVWVNNKRDPNTNTDLSVWASLPQAFRGLRCWWALSKLGYPELHLHFSQTQLLICTEMDRKLGSSLTTMVRRVHDWAWEGSCWWFCKEGLSFTGCPKKSNLLRFGTSFKNKSFWKIRPFFYWWAVQSSPYMYFWF